MPIRFVFGLHNHQPVGNFDGVFEQAHRDSYQPFLELVEQYPEIPITLHISGPLLEWQVERRPEYVARLRNLVARKQVELLGGGFFEPILSMLPRRDRVGQIRDYTAYLGELFGCKIRGMWLAERVWEPELVSDLHQAGIEFTLLDDYHFKQAGLEDHQLFHWLLTEDEGRLLKVFPISEAMRYLVPWKEPQAGIDYLRHVSQTHGDAVVVCADDGEKFGGWPETHTHCFTHGWLRRFFDLLRQHQEWIQFRTLSQAVDETAGGGLVYLPDCSYREMTEWSLPTPRLLALHRMLRSLEHDPRSGEVQRFLRGGFWRNFRAKYPEVNEMYARMLQVSRRLQRVEGPEPKPHTAEARKELYRGQCNCAYWHGAFGGLYLPHLRHAIYRHLIRAEYSLMHAQSETVPLIDAAVVDFNLDARPEVELSSLSLAAYFAPHQGGMLYELDVRTVGVNLLATLARRPEPYHQTILKAAGLATEDSGYRNITDQVKFKQPGLEKKLHYDRYPRKSMLDHFYEPALTLHDLIDLRDKELGDFLQGDYEFQTRKTGRAIHLVMQRTGTAAGAPARITKEVILQSEGDTLTVRYLLDKLPLESRLHFAVEFNFAGMAAGADDRYFYLADQSRAGRLETLHDLANASFLGLADEWLGLRVGLTLSRPGGIWAFPIQTVSQSEGGFELVHQSTAVVPHWIVEPDAQGRWQASIEMKLDAFRHG